MPLLEESIKSSGSLSFPQMYWSIVMGTFFFSTGAPVYRTLPLMVSPDDGPAMMHHAVTKTITQNGLARLALWYPLACISMIFASHDLVHVNNTQAGSLVYN